MQHVCTVTARYNRAFPRHIVLRKFSESRLSRVFLAVFRKSACNVHARCVRNFSGTFKILGFFVISKLLSFRRRCCGLCCVSLSCNCICDDSCCVSGVMDSEPKRYGLRPRDWKFVPTGSGSFPYTVSLCAGTPKEVGALDLK